MQKPSLTLIAILLFFSALFPLVGFLGRIALYFYNTNLTKYLNDLNEENNNKLAEAETKAATLISEAQAKAADITNQANEYYQQSVQNAQIALSELATQKVNIETEISKKNIYLREIEEIKQEIISLTNSYNNQKKKLADAKALCKNAKAVIEKYFDNAIPEENINILVQQIADIDQLDPTVTLKINALDYQDLRKEFLRNQKLIKQVTEKYATRYTLKTYAAIYKLMVLALSAELQNILTNLRYDKLDVALSQVKEMIEKYINIATEGNKTIAPTILAFIAEIEGLYIEAVKIEYEYYIKRERAREEQAMLKEQMRQVAA